MASQYRAMNSAASVGEPVVSSNNFPVEALSSRDFAVRCDRNPRIWKPPRRLPRNYSVDQMIDHRVNFSEYNVRVDPRLDVLFVRFQREATYCLRLADLLNDAVLLRDADYFDARLLMTSRAMIWETGTPSESEYDGYMPLAWRRWERSGRNRYGVFVAVQHREVMGMMPWAVRAKYPLLPVNWHRFEVPYGMNPQAPPILTYYGLELAWNPPAAHSDGSLFWKVLYTEHAWLVAAELLHEARRGTLWWIPHELIVGIEQVGLEAICFEFPSQVADLQTLLYEISVIRWDKVPRRNGPVPRVNFHKTPVYNSGDCVDFDVENWCTQLSDDMYIATDANGTALEGMVDRGDLQEGELIHEVAEPVADAHIYREMSEDGEEGSELLAEAAEVYIQSLRDAQPAGANREPVRPTGGNEVEDELDLTNSADAEGQSAYRVNVRMASCSQEADAMRSIPQVRRLTGEVAMVNVAQDRATVEQRSENENVKRDRQEPLPSETNSRKRQRPIASASATVQVKEEAAVIDVDALFPSSPEDHNA